MPINLIKKNNSHRKGQLAPFFVIVILIILVAALISVNLGKIAQTKTYTGNSSDAAALGAASVLAYAFNYVAYANTYFEYNYRRFRSECYYHFAYAWNKMVWAIWLQSEGRRMACKEEANPQPCPFLPIGNENPCAAINYVELAIDYLRVFTEEIYLLRDNIIPNFYEWERGFYKRVRQRVHRIEPHKNDLYNQALVAGYKTLFFNGGIAVKLRREEQPRFYSWVNSASVENVENNKVENFPQPFGTSGGPSFWTDREGREHYVWGQVKINPIRDYQLRHTVMTYWEEEEILLETIREADKARGQLYAALHALNQACAYFICWISSGCTNMFCYGMFKGWCMEAVERLFEAEEYMQNALQLSHDSWDGLQIERGYTTLSQEEDQHGLIIAWIDDIEHNRLTQSYSRQLHEGNRPGGGTASKSSELWVTWYPMTHGATEATFNYDNRGHICFRHDGVTCDPRPKHDAAITEVDFTKEWLPGGYIP